MSVVNVVRGLRVYGPNGIPINVIKPHPTKHLIEYIKKKAPDTYGLIHGYNGYSYYYSPNYSWLVRIPIPFTRNVNRINDEISFGEPHTHRIYKCMMELRCRDQDPFLNIGVHVVGPNPTALRSETITSMYQCMLESVDDAYVTVFHGADLAKLLHRFAKIMRDINTHESSISLIWHDYATHYFTFTDFAHDFMHSVMIGHILYFPAVGGETGRNMVAGVIMYLLVDVGLIANPYLC